MTDVTRHTVTGKELYRLLADCPSDAYPEGIKDADDCLWLDGELINNSARYELFNNARDRKNLPNTIDIDWSVSRIN